MLEALVSDPSDHSVRRFAKKLTGRQKAVVVPRLPMKGAEYGRCFYNASAYAIVHGGKVLSGWAVRTSPKLFLEAEQHAIVRVRNGDLLDVTPHPRGETSTCFVEDEELIFSAAGGATVLNQYFLTCSDALLPKVEELIEMVTYQRRLMFETGNPMYGFNMSSRVAGLPELLEEITKMVSEN